MTKPIEIQTSAGRLTIMPNGRPATELEQKYIDLLAAASPAERASITGQPAPAPIARGNFRMHHLRGMTGGAK